MRPRGIISELGPMAAFMTMAIVGCADPSAESPSGAKVLSRNFALDSSAVSRAAPAESTKTPASPAVDKESSATAGRKIIYNATVDLVTEDLNALESTLTQLVATRKAYVADSERSGSAGATRRGFWKVRVPVDGYDAFVKGVVSLGEPVSVKSESQDVSEEYYDLDARQAAKKIEEARLLKHLADSTGKLEEILAVERELARVRGEIEGMLGRLKVLANLTELATVTITASEIKGYVPPRAPTLTTRIGRTFSASLTAMSQCGEAALLGLVAAAPWIPPIALLLWVILRATRRRSRRAGPAVEP